MSAENSIAKGGREQEAQGEPIALDLPPEVQSRYDIRLVDALGSGEQRIGLFAPNDRTTPAIEITGDRIVAHREDAQTIDSLVRIAQHNGWDRIDVDGSPEFRKAVYTAATREGLAVSGYEPAFAEQEQAAKARRDREQTAEVPAATTAPQRDPDATIPARLAPTAKAGQDRADGAAPGLSDADSRLLLKVSALTEDRKALYHNLDENMDPLAREVRFERIDDNRDQLNSALERALESPAVVNAFQRAGYEPATLRAAGRGGEWDSDVADAIYLARTGRHRDTLPDIERRGILADRLDADREAAEVAESTTPAERRAEIDAPLIREDLEHSARERNHENEELADLFLHGAAEAVANDPRLAGAREVQAVMEQHIGEVYRGDTTQMTSANLESRQMISDALRRGLDVSVRVPEPVRQIEPIQTRPDLER